MRALTSRRIGWAGGALSGALSGALMLGGVSPQPAAAAPTPVDALAAPPALRSGAPEIYAAVSAEALEAIRIDLANWRAAVENDRDDWSQLSAIVAARPEWPRSATLQRRAEWVAPESLSTEARLAFFERLEPITARGARLYGEALIASGEVEAGREWIIRGWRERVAPRAERSAYLSRHKSLIEPHTPARIDMLIWRERYSAAQRLAGQASAQIQAFTYARIALLRGARGVDGLLDALPRFLRDSPEIAFGRLVWRERRGRRSGAEEIAAAAQRPDQMGRPEGWASARLRFARDAFEEGRYDDAARIAGGHGLNAGLSYARLEWFAGWMLLRHLDQPVEARLRFETMWGNVSTAISRSRAAFWAGEAAAAQGDAGSAGLWWSRAAEFPSTYYGRIAAERLGLRPSYQDPTVDMPSPAAAFEGADLELAIAAELLYHAGDADLGRSFLLRLARRQTEPAQLRAAAATARAMGDPTAEIRVSKAARDAGVRIWSSLFPQPVSPQFDAEKVEPALLMAIARQESEFKAVSRSRVGALGVMQIMPATARATARAARVPYDRTRLANEPAYGVMLADHHVAELLDRFDGSYVLTIAAYNAGSGNVRKWIQRFGDPRDPDVDPIDWIESIPFLETRNYVQRVLEGLQGFRGRLAGRAVPVMLMDDLNR